MSIVSEFREFAIKGNMIEMAVGIIVGAAFTKIVDSLVKDIVMPPIGLLLGGTDFRQLYISLNGISYPTIVEAEKAGAPLLRYGAFISTVVEFAIVAFAIFMVLKGINRLRRRAPGGVEARKS